MGTRAVLAHSLIAWNEKRKKSALNSAWRRAMAMAIKEKVLVDDVRFALHGLKHRGMTDTAGTRADKQQASGHKNERMVDVYDYKIPIAGASGKPEKTPRFLHAILHKGQKARAGIAASP